MYFLMRAQNILTSKGKALQKEALVPGFVGYIAFFRSGLKLSSVQIRKCTYGSVLFICARVLCALCTSASQAADPCAVVCFYWRRGALKKISACIPAQLVSGIFL